MPAFRTLFPQEILSPGQMVGVAAMSLMTTAVSNEAVSSDVAAALQARDYYNIVSDTAERHSGAVLRAGGERIRVAFHDPEQAVQTALAVSRTLQGQDATSVVHLRIAIHHGSAVALTIDNRLDYMGEAAKAVEQLFAVTKPGDLMLSAGVTSDPVVAMLLNDFNLRGTVFFLEAGGFQPLFAQRFDLRNTMMKL